MVHRPPRNGKAHFDAQGQGLNGALDRLLMLTWIIFLKFLDDLEIQREGEAKLAEKKFKPAIEPPRQGKAEG